jgi:hypothetical protein
MLPVVSAFADGEDVQFFDSQMIYEGKRGCWRTAENIGFGRTVDYYRMIKNGETIYFGRPTYSQFPAWI